MIILDSNIWIAYFDTRDTTHNRAARTFEEINAAGEVVGVPEYVVLETATMMARRIGKKESDAFLDFVFNAEGYEVIPSSPAFLDEVVRQYKARRTKKLSFTDVSLLVLAREAPVRTFDKNLQRELRKVEQ